MKTIHLKCLVVVLTLMLNLMPIATAQSPTGKVRGRVIDQRGEYLPEVSITLKNINTGIQYRTISASDSGAFNFPGVQPGKYALIADKTDFQSKSIEIEVTVTAQLKLEVTLAAAGAQVTQDVSASSGVQLEPGTPGQLIAAPQIIALPQLTRNIYEMVSLAAGTTPTSDSRGIGLSSNGQRAASGNYVIDGGENNDTYNAGPAQRLPIAAIQEFKILTNNYSAEYGRNAGFNVNIVSSSGTNDFHANAYLFNRNSALSSNSFDFNANNLKRPVFNRNQFGGAIGGPIVKKRLFFLLAAEPITVRSIADAKFFVPTEDFFMKSNDGTKAIFLRGQQNDGNGFFFERFFDRNNKVKTLSDLVMKDFCPPNRILQNRQCDPRATRLKFPAYGSLVASGLRDAGAGEPQDSLLASARFDYQGGDKTTVYGRYSVDKQDVFALINQPYTEKFDQSRQSRAQNGILNLIHFWSNNFFTESRVTYSRLVDSSPETVSTDSPGNNDFPGYFPTLQPITVVVANTTNVVDLPFGLEAQGNAQNIYQFQQTASLTKGNHFFTFGGQYTHIRDNRIIPGLKKLSSAKFNTLEDLFVSRINVSFSFDAGNIPVGDNIEPSKLVFPAIKRHFRYNEASFFFQNSWKLRPNLTLAAGLRWEYFGVPYSVGSEKRFDSNFYYGEGANVFERISNGFVAHIDGHDDPLVPEQYKGKFYLSDYNNFAPRLGIAWEVLGNGRMVIRSGGGIFYDRNFGSTVPSAGLNPPDYTQKPFVRTLNKEFVAKPFPFPDAITLRDFFVRHLDPNLRTAYTTSWNFGVSSQVNNYLFAEVTYVGASGSKLYSISNLNKVNSGTLLLDVNSALCAQTERVGNCKASPDITNDPNRLNTFFGEISSRSNLGHSTYHSLQVRTEINRLQQSLGLLFGANYTYGHAVDNISSVFGDDRVANPIGSGLLAFYRPDLDKGDADFDVRQRLVMNFVWDLPLGNKAENRLVRNVLGGWSVSGILSFQTGQPFSIFDSSKDFTDGENPRPRLAGNRSIITQRVSDAMIRNTFLYIPLNQTRNANGDCINTGAFFCAATGGEPLDGTISRNIFRRPGTQYHNLAVTRTFALAELFGLRDAKLQLRGEFYNIFNHANLYVNAGSNDLANALFSTGSSALSNALFNTASLEPMPAVTIRRGNFIGRGGTVGLPSFIDNRQVVIAVRLIF